MKKKTFKKLVLAKETLRVLEEPVFARVVGGTSGVGCPTNGFTYGSQCPTWGCPTSNGPYECANACAPDGPP